MKSLWRMSRRRPARRITQKNNSIGGVCRLTYCNPKQIGGILIAKLIVAEKPSVAMSYAKVLGATNRQDGYLEGNGYLVSWCVGHLVELAPPNVYDAKYVKWSIADLPILPQKWQYLVSASTKKQFGILQKLMHRPDVDSIVCATDAGREGELIFRLVYQQAGCKKPFSRLWLSSMEENAIREGFAHLKPSTEYDALYNAALCRERADWMVGINASRLFSCLYGQPLAVGRVMTPVLAMTVVRNAAIAAFVPEKFYTVDLELTSGCTASSRRIPEKSVAEDLLEACRKEMVATIQRITRKEKSENPPPLYDLTTLQRDANRLLGYSAQQTLDYVQSLYEKKLTTYPRTDSCYITDDDEEMLEELTEELEGFLDITSADVDEAVPRTRRTVNREKVTDHHAILPTRSMLQADLDALPKGEQNVLKLIIARTLMAVSKPFRYLETLLTTECAGEKFTAKGKEVLEEGWKAVERKVLADILNRKQELTALPNAAENECGILNAELKEGQTSPPKHFTEDTLLHAMETASADSMPEGVERQGIGTPATRAATIEKLVQKGFLERKGSKKTKVLPTDKGKALITVMPEEIQSPEMTADWETKLLQIERSEMEPETFMTEIKEMISSLVTTTEAAKGANTANEPKVSFRNGRYYVTDGQHTIEARILRNGGKDLPILCKVYTGLTMQQEALFFAEQNGHAAPLTAGIKLRAKVVGEDALSMAFLAATNRVGLDFNYDSLQLSDYRISCVGTALKLYNQMGEKIYCEALRLIVDAWEGKPDSFRAAVLKGVMYFVEVYHGEFNEERLIRALRSVHPMEIYRTGMDNPAKLPGWKKYVFPIYAAYNGKSRKDALPMKF